MKRILEDRTARRLRTSARRVAGLCLLGGVAAFACGCFLTPNLPPTSHILQDVGEGPPPLSVRFDGTASLDSDGIVCTYVWSFGDGVTSSAMRPVHEYLLPGSYVVTLTVTDDVGDSATTSAHVRVDEPNAPPAARFTVAPSTPIPGETAHFDATGCVDEDGEIVAYRWDFGDGEEAQGAAADHAFQAAGVYRVELQVVDDDAATASRAVDVVVADVNQPPQPLIDVSVLEPDPGEEIVVSATRSVDEDGEIVSFLWDFGDGTQASGATASHVYPRAGSYRLTLTATDDRGASRSAARTLSVGQPPEPEPPPAPDAILCRFRWSFGGTARSLSLSVPASLYESYQGRPRGVWTADGYSRFVTDASDEALLLELRNLLMINNSYQATVENALAFVQKGISYQADPVGSDYPRYPVETLVDGLGDCEDTAILYASLVRTFGHAAGALLVSVDTDQDQVADHIAVLVRVADCFIESHPDRSLWTVAGRTYAFAETAVSGGTLALGVDPWGLQRDDIHNIWDADNPSAQLHAEPRNS